MLYSKKENPFLAYFTFIYYIHQFKGIMTPKILVIAIEKSKFSQLGVLLTFDLEIDLKIKIIKKQGDHDDAREITAV